MAAQLSFLGELRVKVMIRDDIDQAAARANRDRALALKLVLRDFVLRHPRCEERVRRELRLPDRRLAGEG